MRDRTQPTPEDVASFQAIESEGNSFLKLLEEKGIAQDIDGQTIFDEEGLKSLMKRDRSGKYWEKSMGFDEVRTGLAGLRGYKKSDLDDPDLKSGRLPPREVLPLPQDIGSLSRDYPETASNAVINIWDLEPNVKWGREIILPSGQKTNTAELFIAAELLGNLKARRNQQGELEIFDFNKQGFNKFTFNGFERAVGSRVQITEPGGRQEGLHSGALFAEKYLPNLLKAGVLKREDFRTTSGSKTAEVLGMGEKKVGANGFVTIGETEGSVKYYIGKGKGKGKAMGVVKLDSNMAGIIEDRHGRKNLAYTFDLLKPEEIRVKREQAAAGRNLKPGEISARTFVDSNDMKARMARYDITQFVPKRVDETPEQYAKRVADLSDVGFVTRKFQGFFAEAGIGLHNLPWSEQLILANAILEEKDKSRLISFAKQYGIEGIRTFLAVDYDPKMAGLILDLGERSPESPGLIFEKYNEIVDVSRKAAQFLQEIFKEQGEQSDQITRISELLMRKAKDLLASYRDPINRSNLSNPKAIKDQMENIKSEILLFAATFKTGSSKRAIEFSELKGTELEIKDSSQITDREVQEMTRIFEENRPGYSPALMRETLDEFKTALKAQGKQWYILKYSNELVAFIRFDQLSDGNLYAGSLNVRPEAKGSAIGSAMLRATLDKQAQDHTIEAVVYSKNPMLKHYTSEFKFKIAGEIPDYHGTGELFYKLIRPQEQELRQAA